MPIYPVDHLEAVITILSPAGQACKVVLHAQPSPFAPGPPNAAHVAAFATGIYNWLLDGNGGQVAVPRPLFDNTTTFVDVVATARGVDPAVFFQLDINLPGQFAGTPLPAETAVVSRWKTGKVGRSFQGRSFWPGVQSGVLDGTGLINSAALAGVEDQLGGIVDVLDSGDVVDLAVFSRKLQVLTEVNYVEVPRTLHHQTRRNPDL